MALITVENLSRALASRGIAAEDLRVQVVAECASTNTQLMLQKKAVASTAVELLLAHQQSAGRGQRGRVWQSLPGQSIMFSLAINLPSSRFPRLPKPAPAWIAPLAGLSAVRALTHMGYSGLQIKWPNDVWWQGRKLAGLLVEQNRERLVLGLGINRLPVQIQSNINKLAEDGDKVFRDPVSLQEIAKSIGLPLIPEPAATVAAIIAEWLALFAQIRSTEAQAQLWQDWEKFDALRGCRLTLEMQHHGNPTRQVVHYRGVNAHGALMVENAERGYQAIHTVQILKVDD